MSTRRQIADKPRVFVSSIMEGYAEYREAARSGIQQAGGHPVLVEDQPAQPLTPRNACLDLVATCDAALFLIGPRGGYQAPSGQLVVREEFEEAQKHNLPSIVLLQDIDRDGPGKQLAEELSDWVGGRLRRTFTTPTELEAEIVRSLSPILENMSRPDRDPQSLQSLVTETSHSGGQYDTVLRFVFAPKIEAELIDPLVLNSTELYRSVQRAAHDTNFLSYEDGKKREVTSSHLRVIQGADNSGRYAEIALSAAGFMTLAATVRGRDDGSNFYSGNYMSGKFEIVKSDLEQMIGYAMALLHEILGEIDEHQRFVSWIYNVALFNPQAKRIVNAPAQQNSGFNLGSHNPDLVTAYERPREINRAQISKPEPEIHRIATLLKQRLDEAHSQ